MWLYSNNDGLEVCTAAACHSPVGLHLMGPNEGLDGWMDMLGEVVSMSGWQAVGTRQ